MWQKIKCLFGAHKWMNIGRVKGTAARNRLFYVGQNQEPVFLCVDLCIHCNAENAYMSSCTGDQKVGVAYAKGLLGIK